MEHMPLNLLLEFVLSTQNKSSSILINSYYPIIFKKLETYDLNNIVDIKCGHNLYLFFKNVW